MSKDTRPTPCTIWQATISTVLTRRRFPVAIRPRRIMKLQTRMKRKRYLIEEQRRAWLVAQWDDRPWWRRLWQ